MKFYSMTWCNCEDIREFAMFTNKAEAQKKHNELKRDEQEGGIYASTHVTDIRIHHLNKLTKKTVVRLFENATQ